jgi:hypothetical protein
MPFVGGAGGTFGYGRPGGAIVKFNYANFASTAGLSLVNTYGVTGNALYITNAAAAVVGNVYWSTAVQYNRNFSVEWNFECSGGSSPPADGFCLQWTTTNNTNGGGGGTVGYISTAIQALLFKTYTNKVFYWYQNNTLSYTSTNQDFYRNLYYWADYTYSSSTMKIYFSTTNTKPTTPNYVLTGMVFNSTAYYIGFGAATGGANENHILRSWKLVFT